MAGTRNDRSAAMTSFAAAQRVVLLDLSCFLSGRESYGTVAITAAAFRRSVYADPSHNERLPQHEMEAANVDAIVNAITRIDAPTARVPALFSIRLTTPYAAASSHALSIARNSSPKRLPEYLVMLSREEILGRRLLAQQFLSLITVAT